MISEHRVLWDWPHEGDIDGVSFESLLKGSRVTKTLARSLLVRAMMLRRVAKEYDVLVVGLAGGTTRMLLLLERLFPTSRRYIVLLHFIPEVSWSRSATVRGSLLNAVKLVNLRLVVRPVVQRNVLGCQVLTQWEVERNARYFDVPHDRMYLTPYPLRQRTDEFQEVAAKSGVLASGRAACDWPTVFAAATGDDWPLTVVCGRRDLKEVQRLNRHGRATVHVDVPADEHARLMESAMIYLLALRDRHVSSGQIRLSDAVRSGTPVVLGDVRGISEYVVPERTALTYPAGDAIAARRQIRRLTADPGLRHRVCVQAFERAGEWTREEYRTAMHDLVKAAAAEVVPGADAPQLSSARRPRGGGRR
jgi:hypothetical protein